MNRHKNQVGIKSIIKEIPLLGNLLIGLKEMAAPRITSFVKGQQNVVENQGSFLNVKIDIEGNGNTVLIGEGAVVQNATIFIRGNGHLLKIGEHCFFGRGELWMEDEGCALIIKKNTTIEHAHLAVTENGSRLEIGEGCMLAKFIEIRTGDSHSIIDIQTGARINAAANVKLEAHVWLGAHAKVLKGVVIGENAVIGTASVVTQSIPPNSIAAGVPAKVIREGVTWKRERI